MIRTTIGGAILVIHLVFLYVYFYGMETGCFGEENNAKVFYLSGMSIYTLYILTISPVKFYETQFIIVGKSSMFIFFIVGVFNNMRLLPKSPYSAMMTFTGLFFATTVMVLLLGRKHGVFNE